MSRYWYFSKFAKDFASEKSFFCLIIWSNFEIAAFLFIPEFAYHKINHFKTLLLSFWKEIDLTSYSYFAEQSLFFKWTLTENSLKLLQCFMV